MSVSAMSLESRTPFLSPTHRLTRFYFYRSSFYFLLQNHDNDDPTARAGGFFAGIVPSDFSSGDFNPDEFDVLEDDDTIDGSISSFESLAEAAATSFAKHSPSDETVSQYNCGKKDEGRLSV